MDAATGPMMAMPASTGGSDAVMTVGMMLSTLAPVGAEILHENAGGEHAERRDADHHGADDNRAQIIARCSDFTSL